MFMKKQQLLWEWGELVSHTSTLQTDVIKTNLRHNLDAKFPTRHHK